MLEVFPKLENPQLSRALTEAYGSLVADLVNLAIYEDPENPKIYVMEMVISYKEQFEDCNLRHLWHVCWKQLNTRAFAFSVPPPQQV